MIKFTRHVKNNMRLYGITEGDIQYVIDKPAEYYQKNDRHVALKIIKDKFSNLPIKVIYKIEKGDTIIITSYPVKKALGDPDEG